MTVAVPEEPAGPASGRAVRLARSAAVGVAVVVACLALAALIVREGARTDLGRGLIVRLIEGVRVGPVGRLRVEGLQGDVFTRFSLRRLTILDAKGGWLEARDVQLSWRPLELLSRRVHAQRLAVGDILITRRPLVEVRPRRPPTEAPVSVRLDALSARIETRPAFSQVAGDWAVGGVVDYARSGRAAGRLKADSRLRRGDGVVLDFTLGPGGRLRLAGEAIEAQGGALAGALGLSPSAPFDVHARASGEDEHGTFAVDARSGGVRPLVAHGDWSPAGAVIEARVALSASHLTRYFADRIGPDLALAITASLRPDGRYAMKLDARGARAQAHATGPVDLRRRRADGVDLALQVADLSAWTHPFQIGPAHARGVFAGDFETFSYRGSLTGERLLQNGYALAALAGPAFVTHDAKGWTFGGDFRGRAGGGDGIAARLLGAEPTLKIAAAFGADRRLSIRDLHLAGADLRVDAQGDQAWRGGLTLKGRAAVPSAAVLRQGSRGGFDLDWTASAAAGDRAWRYGFDLRGRGLSSGVAELDRLLGPSPRLTSQGSYLEGDVGVTDAVLQGAAARGRAHGRLARGGDLGLDVSWSAEGPFLAGPLEISGRMDGGGRIDGPLSTPRAELQADLAALDLGRLAVRPAHLTLSFQSGPGSMGGRVALTGETPHGPAVGRADFHLSDGGLELSNLTADAGGVRLAGAVSLRDADVSSANLTLAVNPGLFLAGGRLSGRVKVTPGPGGASASAAFEGSDLVAPGSAVVLRRVALRADGPLDRLPLRLSAEAQTPIAWRLGGEGLLTRAGRVRTLSFSGAGRVRGADVRTLAPLQIRFGPDERSLQARLTVAGGEMSVGATDRGGALAAHATLASVDLALLSEDYLGKLTAAVELEGAGPRLAGKLDAALSDARTRDAPRSLALSGDIHGVLGGGAIEASGSVVNAQGLRAHAQVRLPAEAAAEPFRIAIDRTRAMHGGFEAQGELRPLWDLFGGGERALSGQLATRGTMGGTLNAPDIEGSATLTKGGFKDTVTGLALQKLSVQSDFAHNLVQVRQFTGDDGRGGTLTGAGQVSLARDGASTFQLRLARFQLLDDELGRATASGAVNVTRDATGRAKLTGRLTVDRADITTKTPTPNGVVPLDVEEINLPGPQGETDSAAHAAAVGFVALDVAVSARGGVLVRGKGIDAELSLDAHVGGTTASPELSGQAHVVRGAFDFSGKRFDFDAGGSIRLATKPEHILLDLKAERNDPSLDAVVRVRGSAARPEITLTSQPVLPQDEILSRVLFGVSASQLSAFQAAQLATALASLATGGGFDVLASVRQFAGLDRLTLGGDASGPAISGGKYLTKDVYLELTGAAVGRSQSATTAAQIQRTGPSAEVEWRIRRDLSLVSQVWAGGDARLSVRFRRNY